MSRLLRPKRKAPQKSVPKEYTQPALKINLEQIAEDAANEIGQVTSNKGLHAYLTRDDIKIKIEFGEPVLYSAALHKYFRIVGDKPETRNTLRRALEQPIPEDPNKTRMYCIIANLKGQFARSRDGSSINGTLYTEVSNLCAEKYVRVFALKEPILDFDILNSASSLYVSLRK